MQFGSTSRGRKASTAGAGWLSSVTLASLAELNELALGLLAEQAAARCASGNPLLRMVGQLWRTLDAGARRQAADCPYLLVDAGFADGLRWQAAARPQVGDAGDRVYAAFFSTPARLRFSPASCSPTPGIWCALSCCGTAVARHVGYQCCGDRPAHLPQIQALAESHTGWLTPRWPERVAIWRELLLAAAAAMRRRSNVFNSADSRCWPPRPDCHRLAAWEVCPRRRVGS